MAMNAQDDPIFGIHLEMHENASQWPQYVPIVREFPYVVKQNGTYFILLEHNIPDYSAGLYYRTKNRWACILTGDALSQVFTVDYTIDVYYGWTSEVTVPNNARVYKNTLLVNVTTIPANDPNIWAVLTPAGGSGGGQTTALNPAWPADFDDPGPGDTYKVGGVSELATRDLVLEGLTDLVWVQPVQPSLTTVVPKEALIKRQIVLTGHVPDVLLDAQHPTSVLLPSGGEWGIINLCTGPGPVYLLNDKTFGESIPLYSNCNAHIATGDTYGVSAVSGDIGGNAYRLPVNQAGGTLTLTTTQLLYHILNIVENPLGPLQAGLSFKFPTTTPPISGTWTFSNNLTVSGDISIYIEGSNGGAFLVDKGEAITVVHNEAGNLILVQTAVSGFLASGVTQQPVCSGVSVAIGQAANALGATDAVAIGQSSTSQGSTVAVGSGSFAQDFSVAVGKGAEASEDGGGVAYGVALGYQSKTSSASIAIGTETNADGASVAIGVNASPAGLEDVAIGMAMPTQPAAPAIPSIVTLGSRSTPSSFADAQSHVSVGCDDLTSAGFFTRRITGVSPGVHAHDAVTMGQIGTIPPGGFGTMAGQSASAVSITGGIVEAAMHPSALFTANSVSAAVHDLGGTGGIVPVTSTNWVIIVDTLGDTAPVTLQFNENFAATNKDGLHLVLSFTEGCALTIQNPHGLLFKGWAPPTSIPTTGLQLRLMYVQATNTLYRIS